MDDRERALSHLLVNAGKLSLALALDAPQAWEIIDRLTGTMDIVIAPLAKTAAARAYFDPARFARLYPAVGLIDVVYRRDEPETVATDLMAVAAGGLLYCNGFPDRAPDYPVGHLAFKQASLVATAVACAMALGQQRHGGGATACISLEEAVMSTTIQAANQNLWRWMGAICRRAGTGGLTYPVLGADGKVALVPGAGAHFETADGRHVVFGMTPFTTERWDSFVRWTTERTGDTSLEGAGWHDGALRAAERDHVHTVMAKLCRSLDRDTLATEGQARGLLIVPVNRVEDIAADPHLIARGCFPPVHHPALGAPVPSIRSPFGSGDTTPPARPAPLLGQHSEQVLRGIAGLSAAELTRLHALGLVGGAVAATYPDSSDTAPPARPQQGAARFASTDAGPGGSEDTSDSGAVPRATPAAGTATAAVPGTGAMPPLPLAGYRVIDFCWQAAGPLMTELLANLGADVIKLESATRIDTVRLFMHPLEQFSIDTGAFFNDCNTGKRSITLDLGKAAGRDLARRLIATADAVTSNFTPGQMERWGFGYDDLQQLRPGIIAVSLPVMGSEGPKRGWRGIGNSVVAMSGLAAHMGHPDRPPVGLGTLQTDFTAPLFGAAALIAALRARERDGGGRCIEIAQYESALHLLDTELLEYLVNGASPPRRGNRSAHAVPHGVFPAAGDDRWLALQADTALEWQRLCTVIGRPDWAARPDLQTLEGRRAIEDEVEATISEWSRRLPAEEGEAALRAADIPAAALHNVADLVERRPGLQEFFTSVEHPAGVTIRLQNQPFTWNGRRLPNSRAPLLGEHNSDVLQGELGIDAVRFEELLISDVIR